MSDEGKVQYLEKQILRLRRENRKRLRQIQDQNGQMEGLQKRIEAMLVSNSWKLTMPLRAVVFLIKATLGFVRRVVMATAMFVVNATPGLRDGLKRFLAARPGLRSRLERLSPRGIGSELSLLHTIPIPGRLSPIERSIYERLLARGFGKTV